jgi:hypothetical protein
VEVDRVLPMGDLAPVRGRRNHPPRLIDPRPLTSTAASAPVPQPAVTVTGPSQPGFTPQHESATAEPTSRRVAGAALRPGGDGVLAARPRHPLRHTKNRS